MVAAQPGVVAAAVAAQRDVAAAAPDGEAVVAQPDGVVAVEAQPDVEEAAVAGPDAVGVAGTPRPDVPAGLRAGAAAAPYGQAAPRVDPDPAQLDPAAVTAALQLRERTVLRRPELHRVGAAAVCRVRPDEAAAQGVPMRSGAPAAALPAQSDE